MPGTPKSDADYIESAYGDAVGKLFDKLFLNMTVQPGDDQGHAAVFADGMKLLKRAKTLAMGAATPVAAPMAARMAKAKKSKAKTG